MENNIVISNKNRKRNNFDYVEIPIKKKRKKSDIKKVAPPTAEEMNRLRETENIFHSNLFRLQIEEMLKEIKMSERTYNKILLWIEELKEFLMNIDISFSLTKGDLINIPNVLFPIKNKSKSIETNFVFMKPKSVNVFGSFSSNCSFKRCGIIDIVVEMPKEIFHKEDYLNERYLVIRNIYLSCLASKFIDLGNDSLIHPTIEFIITNNSEKPLLRIKPNSEKLQKYNFYIHLVPESGILKETRFCPSLNNIRYGWYFETAGDGKLNSPSPYYNSVVCQDLVTLKNEELRKNVFSESPNFKDAFLLLKVWLQQRNLKEGVGAFSGFLLAMFIVYLRKMNKLNHLMSSYQIIRTVWLGLDQTNWHSEGISLVDTKNECKSDHLKIFNSNYDVVFVDVTGNVNLASILTLPKYMQIKFESKYALQCLDDPKVNSFPALFMTPVVSIQEFDHLIYFRKLSVMKKVVRDNASTEMQLDFRNNIGLQFLNIIIKMLNRALGQRVSDIAYIVNPTILSWHVNEKIPHYKNVILGLKLNSEHAYDVIDKGPMANLPEGVEFRKFWGSKSELRRFKDGSVCETVCWVKNKDTLQMKRLIIRDIINYILETKFEIKQVHYLYIADQLESIIYDNYNKIFTFCGTGEEAVLKILSSFNDLSIKIRHIKDLPFQITSIQGTSAVFRYSDPFTNLPHVHSTIKKGLNFTEKTIVFKSDIFSKHTPLYISPIEAVIQLSVSKKWPDDLDAIRRLQAAFYIKLSSNLTKICNCICYPNYNYIDILKDGYVFRIRISNNSEISALKRQINSEGLIEYCDNDESMYLEKKLVQLPILSSAIHGLHQQYPAFGPTCSISKRWLRSQLLDDYYIPDICVDLLLSHLFLNAAPYTVSYQPQTMFIRFLKLISTLNWYLETIIVNFNDKLSREEILEIESTANKNRESLTPLTIATPFDKSGTLWSQPEPSVVILRKLTQLADAALHVIELSIFNSNSVEEIKTIFRPPLKGYDIIICIIPTVNSLRWMNIDADINTFCPIKNSPEFKKLPIVDFHPVRLYIEELRKYYGEFCLFFYDFYGGDFIGVVLKPETKLVKEFKVSNMKCSQETKNKLYFNVEAMIDDFHILGSGIVERIERY